MKRVARGGLVRTDCGNVERREARHVDEICTCLLRHDEAVARRPRCAAYHHAAGIGVDKVLEDEFVSRITASGDDNRICHIVHDTIGSNGSDTGDPSAIVHDELLGFGLIGDLPARFGEASTQRSQQVRHADIGARSGNRDTQAIRCERYGGGELCAVLL